MIKPAHIQTTSFFYATGNTPAVCLTKALPPDKDVSLLLLGCGDVRNVLLTAYVDLGNERTLDLTCCDIEPEITARNVVLYTLIIDDINGEHVENIWNIYHHALIDETSLNLLRSQSAKLKNGINTIEDWNDGKYGNLLRFCNGRTFSQVMKLLNFYALDSSHGREFTEQQKILERLTKKAHKLQRRMVGNGTVLTGLRSVQIATKEAINDVSQAYRRFWENGTSAPRAASGKTDRLNPLFGTPNEYLILHYGTDPLLGYNLSTAYMPVAENSPFKPNLPKPNATGNGYRTAFGQFCDYAKAFRALASRCVLRFVNSDALAFCHTLQHLLSDDKSKSAGWYSDNWTYEPLSLDSQDYTSLDSKLSAPLSFDMIDASNLLDHLGCLNLLAAASPLLAPTPMSTMCMEMLVLRDENMQTQLNNLVSGDPATVSLLFGLTPVQYWTGATVTCNLHENINEITLADSGRQSRFIMCWKRTVEMRNPIDAVERISLRFDAQQLAFLVYGMYLHMFRDESWENRLSTSSKMLSRNPYEHYTRASLAATLRLIKNSDPANWFPFIRTLVDLILGDRNLQMGPHYIQGLFLHLHMLGLYTYEPGYEGFGNLHSSPLSHWKNIPSQLCVTLTVPAQKVTIFRTASPQEFGSPIAHIMLESATDGMQNTFPDIQFGFGRVEASGERFTESFAVHVKPDQKGWDGKSPLIVSVMVPTWIVLSTRDLSTKVIFALKSTPQSLLKLGKHLGMFLEIYRSTLMSENVFITKHRPNMSRNMSICPPKGELGGAAETQLAQSLTQPGKTKLSFHISLDEKNSRASSLATRVDFLSKHEQDILRDGVEVVVETITPYKIAINLNSGAFRHVIDLPIPLLMTGTKTRVARKSSYVEFIADVAEPQHLLSRPDNVFPVDTFKSTPLLRNLDYVNLDKLPILDTMKASKLQWLSPLVASMLSGRERAEREKHLNAQTVSKDARVNFKDSLFTLFMRFTGAQGGKHQQTFGLYDPKNGGFHVLIIPAELRLDTSNQGVVLDAAVISLTPSIVSKLAPILSRLDEKSILSINVDDAELRLWKHVLPSLAERCRHWTHIPECEYKKADRIPLSTDPGQPTICSCGVGKFPSSFKVSDSSAWESFRKYAVRVAISPCYSAPFVEKQFNPRESTMQQEQDIAQAMEQLEVKKGSCSSCGKQPSQTGKALLQCSRCKSAQYCSKECQVKDWKEGGHKRICKLVSES